VRALDDRAGEARWASSAVSISRSRVTAAGGRISVRLRSRGRGRVRAINIPNLPSSTVRISVQLNDFG
jgi:hypothetical protein